MNFKNTYLERFSYGDIESGGGKGSNPKMGVDIKSFKYRNTL